MKAARLGRTPAHDKGASHAIRFPRAIRYTIECTLHEHSIVMKRICDAFRCCRSSRLLIHWRSLYIFRQPDFHASMESGCREHVSELEMIY